MHQYTYCEGQGTTGSSSAVYIPQVEDLDPPYVEVATTGSGLTTKAIAEAIDPGEQSMSLHWDFGDGTTQLGGFGSVVSHTYSAPGNFVVTATATAADGRQDSATASAKVGPPRPILQSVARIGTGTTGVAAGTLQGWPANSSASLRYWTDGCPTDPDVEYQYAVGSGKAFATAEGTVSMNVTYLDPAANAFVLEAEARVPAGGSDTVTAHRVSECVEMTPGAPYETTAATAIDDTEVPVDSASVPVGHVAVIDAGAADHAHDLAEQREVTGHGSLFVAPLARVHPEGALVIDAGEPLAPYVLPGPPADPTLEELGAAAVGGGSGGGGGRVVAPGRRRWLGWRGSEGGGGGSAAAVPAPSPSAAAGPRLPASPRSSDLSSATTALRKAKKKQNRAGKRQLKKVKKAGGKARKKKLKRAKKQLKQAKKRRKKVAKKVAHARGDVAATCN